MQQADRTHTSTGASTSLTNGELGNGHRSEGWTVAVGALFALIAMREGFRWIQHQPAVTQLKHTSMVDALGAGFMLSQGLRRVGAWALRPPTGNARS